MIKSRIYADKAFYNIQNSFVIQNSQKTRNRGKLTQFDEEYLKKKKKKKRKKEKTIANSTIYSVKFKTYSLGSGTRQRYSLSLLLFNLILKVLANAIMKG